VPFGEVPAYEAMAPVYDRWMEHDGAPYEQWCGFIDTACRRHDREVRTILEIGCGTGSLTQRLGQRGYEVTGVDASSAMLGRAREKLGPSVRLVHARLPVPGPPQAPEAFGLGLYDAAVCCFDVVNYFVEDGELARVFRQVRRALRPGGLFIFDVNTRYKLQRLFGDRSFGDDLGDFAYVQRARYDPARHRCELFLTFFLREGEMYRRAMEHHVQRWFTDEEMCAALADSGFEVLRTCQGYTDVERTADTARATWVVRA
jgi:SAM-dependent methyltransferase